MAFDKHQLVDTIRSWKTEQDISEELERFRLRDFRHMTAELAKILKHRSPPLRHIPFVSRVARELARLYIEDPTRRFDGDGASELEETYERSDLNGFLDLAARKTVVHQSQLLAFDPDGTNRVKPRAFSMYQFDIEWDDPLETDVREAREVRIKVPVARVFNGHTARIKYGYRVYTRHYAYTEFPDGTRRPIFPRGEAHGLDYVPLVLVRGAEDADGWGVPTPPHDLQSMAVAVPIVLSDGLYTMMYQHFAREYLIGAGAEQATKEKPIGPNKLECFDVGDEQHAPQHVIVQPDPAIENYFKALETAVRIWSVNAFVRPESLLQSTGITGNAKALELQPEEEERKRTERIWRRAEQQVVEVIADVRNITPGNTIRTERPQVRVRVKHNYVRPRLTNDLQGQQARRLAASGGLLDLVDEVARDERITAEEAVVLLRDRVVQYRDIFGEAAQSGNQPGVDRLEDVV